MLYIHLRVFNDKNHNDNNNNVNQYLQTKFPSLVLVYWSVKLDLE